MIWPLLSRLRIANPSAAQATNPQSPDAEGGVNELFVTRWVAPSAVGLAGLALIIALTGRSIITQVAGLYELAASPNPYFHPSHALLLYLVTPVVVVASFALFMLPGALLVLALRQARRVEELVVFGFGYSIMLTIVVSTTAKLILGPPLAASVFIGMWASTIAFALALLIYRLRRGEALALPLASRSDVRRLLWMVSAVVLGVTLLLPKIFWEDFNLDGVEAFEFGRSLTTYALPNWKLTVGVFGFYHNFWLFAFPNHWFITLFGPIEAAARLPFLLYLPVLFAAMVLLIEHGSSRRLSGLEEATIWLGLALYTVVQAFSTNYEPFFADLAEMAATDTLGILTFLAACYTLWDGRKLWFLAFALMTFFAAPGGLLLLGLLAAFIFMSRSPQRREQLIALGGVIVACVTIGLAYEHLYTPLVYGTNVNQFSALGLAKRLYPPDLTEFVRINAIIFTTGVLPAISLFFVRRGDWRAWTLAGMSIVFFVILYAQSWAALHQFTPVMVIPVVVFWRLYLNSSARWQRWLVPALGVTTMVSLALSLPQHFQISTATRELGYATAYRIGDYEQDYEAAASRATRIIWNIVDSSYRLQYPEQPWGTDEFSWLYYAAQEKPEGVTLNYVVQPADASPPPDFTQVKHEGDVAVYIRDFEVWERDRGREMPRVITSSLYEPILRETYRFFREYTEERLNRKITAIQP